MSFSVRTKWTAALLLAAGLPLAAASHRSLTVQGEGLRRVEQELEAAVVDQTSTDMALRVDEVRTAVRQGLQLALDERVPVAARMALLQERVGSQDGLQSLVWYDERGELLDAIVRTGVVVSRAALDASLRAELAERGTAQRVARGDDGVARILLAERSPAGIVLVGVVDPASLEEVARSLSTVRFGHADRISVLSTDDGLRRLAGGENRIPPSLLPDQTSLTQAFVRTAEFVDSSGIVNSGTVRNLPDSKLLVAVTRPTSEAYASLERSKRDLALSLAAAAAFAALLGVVMARRVTKPVAALTDLAARYGRREWGSRSAVRTGDELETLGSAMTSMADAIAASEGELQKRAILENQLGRFLPTDVARQIAAGERTLELGGERREVAVLFADVANFTGFSEHREVEEVVQFLNEVFGILSEVVFRHGGMVDKFVGDSVMALFGVREETECASAAVAAAEDMTRFVQANADRWKDRWRFDTGLGIGIALGTALVGNLGTKQRMDFTAIGDVVNVAARLESMARPGEVLVTGAVAAAASDGFEYRALGVRTIRGRSEPLEVLALVTE